MAAEPKIVNISSFFGSISGGIHPSNIYSTVSLSHPLHQSLTNHAGNSFGTCMAYRAAKTALNQMSVTMAREWEKEGRKSTIVCMEPGFLSTRLTGFDGEDDMETCIAGIMNVIDHITHDDSGAFLKWDGTKIPF